MPIIRSIRGGSAGLNEEDTHVGSASSLIAFHENGNLFVGFEKDKHMYDLSIERYIEETAQMRLSDFIKE